MSEKLLDAFARGKLSAAESRALAQKALDDHALFDALTAAALERHGPGARAHKQTTWPRFAILAAGVALIVGVSLYLPQRNVKPAKPEAAMSAPPVLLARNGDSPPTAFRGLDSDSRQSRATGSVASVDGGIVAIDLGSIDGLAKDAAVDLIRDGHAVGQIRLTTVFRDHSRGETTSGRSIRVNDQVRVPPSARLRAILDEIDAILARGEAEKAMSIAQQASADSLGSELSTEQDLNNAGVIAELHGNPSSARELYRRALETSPSGKDRQVIEKNLARVSGAQ